MLSQRCDDGPLHCWVWGTALHSDFVMCGEGVAALHVCDRQFDDASDVWGIQANKQRARHMTGALLERAGDGLFSTEGCPSSIVSAETFHYRVRDGNGWFRLALVTEVLWKQRYQRHLHVTSYVTTACAVASRPAIRPYTAPLITDDAPG